MADITEALITRLKAYASLAAVHVGEVIPQEQEYPYVWLMRSGESTEDSLKLITVPDTIQVDVEIVSDDIAETRTLAAGVKNHLKSTTYGSISFTYDDGTTKKIRAIDVDDHDDNYLYKGVDSDEQLHVAALNVSLIIGN